MERTKIYEMIDDERDFQDNKWGPQRDNSGFLWATILMEEVGELAQEVLRCSFEGESNENLIKEAVQCAAVLTAWLENIKPDLKVSEEVA